MARIGVTYLEVLGAIEAIQAQQQPPTIERIRQHLGTGSASTIARHLRQWREAPQISPETSGLPQDLLQSVEALHERVQSQAAKRIAAAEAACAQALAERQQALELAQQRSQQLEQRLQQAHDRLSVLENEQAALTEAHQATQMKLQQAAVQQQAAADRIAHLQSAVAERRQENQDIRSHFLHYQAHVAEERQRERVQHQEALQQIQAELTQTKNCYQENLKEQQALVAVVAAQSSPLPSQRPWRRSRRLTSGGGK